MLNTSDKKVFLIMYGSNCERGENPVIESVQRQSEKFDGLANDYDRDRPRYPLTLFKTMLHPFKNKKHLSIVDVGGWDRYRIRGNC